MTEREQSGIGQCDLQRLFGDLVARLPTRATDGYFTFTLDTLPRPPVHLATNRLVVKKRGHEYNTCFRVDSLVFYAHRPTYRALGVLILAVVLHPEPVTVRVTLTHPASEVKTLDIAYALPAVEHLTPGYYTQPVAFHYAPDLTARHPWRNTALTPDDFPCFWLTSPHPHPTDVEWQHRDTLRGFGSDYGSVLLAQLLLDAGCPENPVDEYDLEGDAGVGGVGRRSAEVTLWLPESLGWDSEDWEPGAISGPGA